jgi:hypothetical protein
MITIQKQTERNSDVSGILRSEFKYLIKSDRERQILEFLSPYIEIDGFACNDTGNCYTIRSIYFDSPDFACFHEKLEGQSKREKFRIRTYNSAGSDSPFFLECKKKNRNKGKKERVVIDQRILEAISLRDYSQIDKISLSEKDRTTIESLFFYIFRKSYFPVVLVTYDREPYISPLEDRIRITFDKNLRAMPFPEVSDIYEDEHLQSIFGDLIVLEIKFDSFLPKWIGDLTTHFGLVPQSVSKYCSALAYFLGEDPGPKDGYLYV